MRLVSVCPNPAIDHTVVVPTLAAGETMRAAKSHTTAGGKGLNVARFARGFGANVTAVTWLGEVGADHLLSLAQRDGLELRAIVVPGVEVRVCPVLVASSDGAVLTTSDPLPVLDAVHWADFVELAANVAVEADAVCIAGSFPRVQGADPVRSLLEAVGSNAPIWIDTSGSALEAVAGGLPTEGSGIGLKVNLAEASALLDGNRQPVEEPSVGASPRTLAVAAAEALSRGMRPVVVTAGRAGAAEATQTGSRWVDAPFVETRNPTASGDAFLAGYVCAGRALLSTIADPLLAGVLAGAVNASLWEPAAPVESVVQLANGVRGICG